MSKLMLSLAFCLTSYTALAEPPAIGPKSQKPPVIFDTFAITSALTPSQTLAGGEPPIVVDTVIDARRKKS